VATGRDAAPASGGPPPFRVALACWARIGWISFGGPAGQIALMHRMLVEERRWIDENRFLQGLNFCMLLPGPEAQQLATYIGWRLHGVRGGVMAGLLFVLPGAAVIFILSVLYLQYRGLSLMDGVFFGVKAAVIAIVLEALLKISKRALRSRAAYIAAGAAFAAIFLFNAPFPLIVAAAALAGFASARAGRGWFEGGASPEAGADSSAADTKITIRRGLAAAAVCLGLWIAPIIALTVLAGTENVFTQQALFFSRMAVVTFGGAYAVLAYVAQQAVDAYGWLTPGEMIDGLGLAETTPGPLVLVLQFVGFLGAAHAATAMNPLAAGAFGGLIALWMTFAPCFLWIFLGGPFIEKLRRARALNAALGAVTAAVVGVVLNLSLWFAVHVVFERVNDVRFGPFDTIAPSIASLNFPALGLAAAAAILLLRFRIGVLALLGAAGLAGVLISGL
jgi:chromate transporter